MKKIIIIGSPGSGKSYFARELNKLTNIPIYYMDRIFWKENWEHITIEELRNELCKIMENDEWIIDGNYSKTMEDRFAKADTVFFLDIDSDICIDRVMKRTGKKREDLPEYLNEEYDPEFIEYIKDFHNSGKKRISELMDKYKDKQYYIFKSVEDKNNFLINYKNNC